MLLSGSNVLYLHDPLVHCVANDVVLHIHLLSGSSTAETIFHHLYCAFVIFESFNDWGGRGYDDFVPGEVTKTARSGDRAT